jgi:hypothetical protein
MDKIERSEREIPLRRRRDSVFNGDATMISAQSSIYLDPESGLGKRVEPLAVTSGEDLELGTDSLSIMGNPGNGYEN